MQLLVHIFHDSQLVEEDVDLLSHVNSVQKKGRLKMKSHTWKPLKVPVERSFLFPPCFPLDNRTNPHHSHSSPFSPPHPHMKRPNQDDTQDATVRGKQARTHGQQPTTDASGSRTIVQTASVLTLQPHTDGDDMNVDSDHELDHDDTTSMDEDIDQDSDLEGELTNNVCIVSSSRNKLNVVSRSSTDIWLCCDFR